MDKLKITHVSINKLKPYENNAKKHPDWQIEQIKNSIEEFGNCDPIGVWENSDGVLEIVEGHGRYLALKDLGHTSVPVIRLDHLSDEQRRAYVHVHNKLTMNTDFDFQTLDDELANLNMDWSLFGFDAYNTEIDHLFTEAGDQTPRDHSTGEEITCPHCGENFKL